MTLMNTEISESDQSSLFIGYVDFVNAVITYDDMLKEETVCSTSEVLISLMKKYSFEDSVLDRILSIADRMNKLSSKRVKLCSYNLLKYTREKLSLMYSVRGEFTLEKHLTTFSLLLRCGNQKYTDIRPNIEERHNHICTVRMTGECVYSGIKCVDGVTMYDIFVYDEKLNGQTTYTLQQSSLFSLVDSRCVLFDGTAGRNCSTMLYPSSILCECEGVGDVMMVVDVPRSFVHTTSLLASYDVFDMRVRRKWHQTFSLYFMIGWFTLHCAVMLYSLREKRPMLQYRRELLEAFYLYIHKMKSEEIAEKFEEKDKKKDPKEPLGEEQETQESARDEESKKDEEKVKVLSQKFEKDITSMKVDLYHERKTVYSVQDKFDSIKIDDAILKMMTDRRIEIKTKKDMKMLREYAGNSKAREMYMKYLEDDGEEEDDFDDFNKRHQEDPGAPKAPPALPPVVKMASTGGKLPKKSPTLAAKLEKIDEADKRAESGDERDDSKEDIKEDESAGEKVPAKGQPEQEKKEPEEPRAPILKDKEAAKPLDMLFSEFVSEKLESAIKKNESQARRLILEFAESHMTMKEADKTMILDRYGKVRLFLLCSPMTSCFLKLETVSSPLLMRCLRFVWYFNSFAAVFGLMYYLMIDVPLYLDEKVFYNMLISPLYSARVVSVWFMSLGIVLALQLLVALLTNPNERKMKMYSDLDELPKLMTHLEAKRQMQLLAGLAAVSLLGSMFMSVYLEVSHGRMMSSSFLQATFYSILIDGLGLDWMVIITIDGVKKQLLAYPVLSLLKGISLPAADVRVLCMNK